MLAEMFPAAGSAALHVALSRAHGDVDGGIGIRFISLRERRRRRGVEGGQGGAGEGGMMRRVVPGFGRAGRVKARPAPAVRPGARTFPRV